MLYKHTKLPRTHPKRVFAISHILVRMHLHFIPTLMRRLLHFIYAMTLIPNEHFRNKLWRYCVLSLPVCIFASFVSTLLDTFPSLFHLPMVSIGEKRRDRGGPSDYWHYLLVQLLCPVIGERVEFNACKLGTAHKLMQSILVAVCVHLQCCGCCTILNILFFNEFDINMAF